MFTVRRQLYDGIWTLICVLLGAGWAAFGLLGGDNRFLTVMVVVNIVLAGGASAVLRRGPRA